jgi:nitroimidazol reductase NimA-like FMN-containing flavoprotein (pyridoxamine 5'-phosphate oxidase superfamily)
MEEYVNRFSDADVNIALCPACAARLGRMTSPRTTPRGKGDLPAVPRRGEADVPTRIAVLDRKRRHAALATDAGGQPYLSLVAFALDADGAGVLFATPRGSRKYRNLRGNPRVSLLLDTRGERDRDYAAAEAVTVLGRASVLRAGSAARRAAEGILLAKHPGLRSFVGAPTTAVVRVAIAEAIHVGGFQRVTRWRPG